MHRRRLLSQLGSAALAFASPQLWAAADPRAPRLLLVFLRGGYDCANLLVPHASPFYYEARPGIAIARPDSGPQAAAALDSQWALAPAVQDSMLPLFQRQQLAFVPFAGTDDVSRSHFETQDRIELGLGANATGSDFSSGFLNRLAQLLFKDSGSARSTLAFTPQLPLALRGPLPIGNQSLGQVSRSNIDERQAALIQSMYADRPMGAAVSDGFKLRAEVAREMAREMEAAGRRAIAAKGFELEARRVARLMRERVQLGFIDVGGWDTHVAQGAASGALADRLAALGRGLAAFADEMGPQWNNSVVVVFSEFGRTFRENGNRGTDHGHGSVYWVLGGAVRGGAVRGEQIEIKPRNLFQERDYPVLNDYRSLLAGLMARLYGLNSQQLAQVFPGASAQDLGLL